MSNEITRKYRLSDGVLLAHIGKVLVQLPDHLSIFEEGIPKINQTFLDQLADDHQTALEEGGDDSVKGIVGATTQALLDEMDRSKKLMKKLRFWITDTFQDNSAKLKGFHLSKFWRYANNQPKLVQYMNMLNKLVNENSVALLDNGMKQELIDDLEDNAEALSKADAEQEVSKSGRSNATQVRIEMLNSIYEMGRLLDRAAELVFEDDPVTIDFYEMPVVRPKAEDVESELEESF